ncbi:MAG: DUF4276 family protein [Chloroflexota bacterium]
MSRLNILVEGQTEETFVNNVLSPHLGQFGVFAVARKVETGRKWNKIFRGGLDQARGYTKLKKDMALWMREDQNPDAFFTTMIDLYAIPADFPGRDISIGLPVYERVRNIEQAFAEDINHPRFIPYIQVHEFEALLFSDPRQFDWEFIDHDSAIQKLVVLLSAFENPELINDDPDTAPSKRIINELPAYKHRKASAGPVIAEKIGLPILRSKCPHFDEWLTRLEGLK